MSKVNQYIRKVLCGIAALTLTAPLASLAGSTNASAKVTLQTSYLNVLGPFTNSTGTTSNVDSGWQTVLEQNIKTANNHDLLINAGFEVGLLTQTTVSSKNMVTDTSTATANIQVRALVDGSNAAPGVVVYGKRTQTLSATLEGAIAGCLSLATNSSGSVQIVLNTNCVTAETIGLLEDTVSANSFIFVAPNLPAGTHNIQIQAEIVAMGDNQNGSFTAVGLLGKGTMTVDSTRVAQDPSYPYILDMD